MTLSNGFLVSHVNRSKLSWTMLSKVLQGPNILPTTSWPEIRMRLDIIKTAVDRIAAAEYLEMKWE
jgi:hypothetical protein